MHVITFQHLFYSIHFINLLNTALWVHHPFFDEKYQHYKYCFGERSIMPYELALVNIPLLRHGSYFFSCFRKMSAAIYGVYDFDAWDITHEFMIYETLSNIQNKFRSADNAFTSLERKCHEISGEFKPGNGYCKLNKDIAWVLKG